MLSSQTILLITEMTKAIDPLVIANMAILMPEPGNFLLSHEGIEKFNGDIFALIQQKKVQHPGLSNYLNGDFWQAYAYLACVSKFTGVPLVGPNSFFAMMGTPELADIALRQPSLFRGPALSHCLLYLIHKGDPAIVAMTSDTIELALKSVYLVKEQNEAGASFSAGHSDRCYAGMLRVAFELSVMRSNAIMRIYN